MLCGLLLQDEGVESDDLKKDLLLMPPPPDSSSMKLTIKEIWFSFAAPTNVRSPSQAISRQLNLLSTATPAIGAWLVPIDQLKSSLRKLDMEGTLRVCAVMGCIMTEALEVSTAQIEGSNAFYQFNCPIFCIYCMVIVYIPLAIFCLYILSIAVSTISQGQMEGTCKCPWQITVILILYETHFLFFPLFCTEKEYPHPLSEQVQQGDQASTLPPREPLLSAG